MRVVKEKYINSSKIMKSGEWRKYEHLHIATLCLALSNSQGVGLELF